MTLTLSLNPTANFAAPVSFDVRPKKVRQWIEELPRGDVGLTARALYEALVETNAATLSPGDRLKFLEQVRPTVGDNSRALRRRYVGLPLPLTPMVARTAQLDQALCAQMANGYRRVVDGLAEDGWWLRPSGQLTSAMYRGLDFCAQVLECSYATYGAIPPNLWLGINHLWLTAERLGLLHVAISEDAVHPQAPHPTIDLAYRRLVLLSVADPYRLSHQELSILLTWSRRWAALTRLERKTPAAISGFPIVVDPHGSAQPARGAVAAVSSSPSWLVLNTEALTQELTSHLDGHGHVVTPVLAKRLLDVWAAHAVRRAARKGADRLVAVAIGLASVHHVLCVASHIGCRAAVVTPPVSVGNASSVQRASRVRDVWQLVTPLDVPGMESPNWTVGDGGEESEGAVTWEPGGQARAVEHPTEDWRLRNYSSSGYGLCWDHLAATRVHVGALVAIEDEDAEPTGWRVCVVRRVRQTRHGLDMGVEFLSGQAGPALVRRCGGSAAEPAVTLQESPQSDLTLLASVASCHVDAELDLHDPRGEKHLRVTRTVARYGSFAHCAVAQTPVSSPTRPIEPSWL